MDLFQHILMYLATYVLYASGRPDSKSSPAEQEVSAVIFKKESAGNVDYKNLGDPKVCGFSSKNSKEEGPRRDWPWMALLLYTGDKTTVQFGGGTVITPRHVLSAAHCFNDFSTKDAEIKNASVVVGDYDLKKDEESNLQRFKIVEYRNHEEYDTINQLNDITIILLDGKITYDLYVQPACLPMPGQSYAGKTAVATGFGRVQHQGDLPYILREVAVPVWKQQDCKKPFPALEETQLCAAAPEGGKDACQLDSGGPLVIQREDGRWTVIGVVSYGIKCGLKGKPGIYTRVTKYLDWLAPKIKEI